MSRCSPPGIDRPRHTLSVLAPYISGFECGLLEGQTHRRSIELRSGNPLTHPTKFARTVASPPTKAALPDGLEVLVGRLQGTFAFSA